MKWLFAALLLLAAGAIYHLGYLVYAMYALVGMLLLSRFLAREWTENIVAKRSAAGFEEPIQIGEERITTLTLTNEGQFPVTWLIVEDALPLEALTQSPPRLEATGPRLGLIQLQPSETKYLEYKLKFLMRGYFQVGPLLIETGDLFGLHRRYKVLTEPQFALVLPKVLPLQGYDISSRRPVGEIRMSHRLFEDPTRIAGIRAYQHGDPFNRIHWHATARTGAFQSKAYEPSSIAGATLLLDFHTLTHHGNGKEYRTELAVTAVASLANALTELGQRVGLVTNGRDAADRIREEGWAHEFRTRHTAKAKMQMLDRSDRLRPVVVETRRGPDQLMRILETLARLELTDGLTLPQLITESASHMPRNASVIAILTDVPPESAIALTHLHRRGYAITVGFITFDQRYTHDWAERPEWAGWLLNSGIDIRELPDEAAVTSFCSDHMLR